jgi:hypothetical protein
MIVGGSKEQQAYKHRDHESQWEQDCRMEANSGRNQRRKQDCRETAEDYRFAGRQHLGPVYARITAPVRGYFEAFYLDAR